ncbi:MAG TPA: condensation domain-containing protein, partial [Jatrophihabitans sp.]|nr:condensation domain-containing protein [Jatrophihabitans sp.]
SDGTLSGAGSAGNGTSDRELAQVRFALANNPDARQVAVTRRRGATGEGPVAACLSVDGAAPTAAEVHELATALLPARLVPAAIAVGSRLVVAPGTAAPDDQPAPAQPAAGEPATLDTLRALFAEVLDAPDAGLHDNFFELGGQSVTAMLLTGRINAALGVRLSIADLFNAPTVLALEAKVRGLRTRLSNPFDAEGPLYLTLTDSRGAHSLWPVAIAVPQGWSVAHGPAARGDCLSYVERHWPDYQPAGPGPGSQPVEAAAAEPAERIPLSFNQEFFCAMDEGAAAGAFSDRHMLVSGWRLRGRLDPDTLQLALNDVVARHEVLRTSIRRDQQPAYQVVHPPSPVRLEIRDLSPSAEDERPALCEQLMTEIESRTFSVTELPLLRAVLGRLAEQDHVLVLTAHHIAIDAWSMQVVIRDLASCYAVRRGFELTLPAVHQYREYCLAQRRQTDPAVLRPALEYWRTTLRGGRAFTLPTRSVPVADGLSRYAMQHFSLDEELTRASLRLARQTSSSPFMVLLSAFYLLARELTGSTDLLVPTFTTGRHEARFLDTVGPFLNYLPVRTDLADSTTFRQVLDRTRTSCLQAYAHDIPFECIEPVAPPTLLQPATSNAGSQVAFEMVQPPAPVEGEAIGDLSYAEVHRRMMFEAGAPDIPDGMLWVLSVVSASEIVGTVQFKRTEFTAAAIADLVSGYRRVLRRAVGAPDEPLPPLP